jgi:malate synthase
MLHCHIRVIECCDAHVRPASSRCRHFRRHTPAFAEILSPEALGFVAKLHRKFESRRQELLAARAARQKEFDAGKLPDFLPQTKAIREGDWSVRRSRRTCSTAASRSPARPTARW